MTEEQLKVIYGGLLHDIGKAVYRSEKVKNHSQCGYEYLKEQGISDKEVLDQVRYHHSAMIKNADIDDNSLAFITYIADNIASGLDRRKKENDEYGFDLSTPIESVFNVLNNNNQNYVYRQGRLDVGTEISFPVVSANKYDESFYNNIMINISDCLKAIDIDREDVDSLMSVMEANLSFIPSSTAKGELCDIPLYDHLKITAAIGTAIYSYLQERKGSNYKKVLYLEAEKFYEEKAFLLYSMDFSGIQDYIYTTSTDGALKALRSRSFYLEIMMEDIIDQILNRTGFSRANLLYAGGGHAYILIDNTEKTKKTLDCIADEIKEWLLKTYSTSLYLASGYTECSANELMNKPEGSYREVFYRVSTQISEKKLRRYSAEDIIKLNSQKFDTYSRECKVCKRLGKLIDDKCPICRSIEAMSNQIMNQDYFVITQSEKTNGGMPLPYDMYVKGADKSNVISLMKDGNKYIRTYGKNQMHTGNHVIKLWVGDYASDNELKKLANMSEGTKKLAVLRADIDNLGQTFVRGFEHNVFGSKYVTISRTAILSRKLSMFFKHHINNILSHSEFDFIEGRPSHKRNAAIIYSGGDDVFLVGSWDDVIGAAVDLRNSLKKYTQDTITISGGIGIYNPSYPISDIARETGKLEDAAKNMSGKNAITLFSDDNTYHWDDFIDKVINEKYRLIEKYFMASTQHGRGLLYQLFKLANSRNEKINIARYAYLLTRLEPSKDASESEKNAYYEFAHKMYEWIKSDEDAKQTVSALMIYAYRTRESVDEQ